MGERGEEGGGSRVWFLIHQPFTHLCGWCTHLVVHQPHDELGGAVLLPEWTLMVDHDLRRRLWPGVTSFAVDHQVRRLWTGVTSVVADHHLTEKVAVARAWVLHARGNKCKVCHFIPELQSLKPWLISYILVAN